MTTAEAKVELLRIALAGEPKPRVEEYLCVALYRFTGPSSEEYDSEFHEKIKNIVPFWFLRSPRHRNISDQQKSLLFDLAAKGVKRPHGDTPIGTNLIHFTNRSQAMFDPVFDIEIRKAAPHWFEYTAMRRDEINRDKILEMARAGGVKPIYHYWQQITKNSEFAEEVKKIAPHWFETKGDRTRKKLLEMAKNGEPKPKVGTCNLALSLSQLICKKNLETYHAEFDMEIRKLAPHWFGKNGKLISKTKKYECKSTAKNKENIIQLAEEGKESLADSGLQISFKRYISEESSVYDSVFAKKIRELAPHWFLKKIDRTKQGILDLAKKDGSVTVDIYRFVNKNSRYYDSVFEAELRELAPNWFKRGEQTNEKAANGLENLSSEIGS